MNNGPNTTRDKYGFDVTSMRSQIAAMIGKGVNDVVIIKKFGRQNVHAVRHAIKVATGQPLDLRFSKKRARSADLLDQWGFALKSRRHKIALMLKAGKTAIELAAAGEKSANIYAVQRLMNRADTKLPVPFNGKALTKKHKTNGHAPNGGFDVPIVEAILHVPGAEPVRVFSSVDIFPAVYARAAKVTGFI